MICMHAKQPVAARSLAPRGEPPATEVKPDKICFGNVERPSDISRDSLFLTCWGVHDMA